MGREKREKSKSLSLDFLLRIQARAWSTTKRWKTWRINRLAINKYNWQTSLYFGTVLYDLFSQCFSGRKRIGWLLKFKVYMTEMFLFAFYNIHSVLITTAKSISIAIFRSHVLSCKKREISLPVGYKTPQVKTGDWEWLWRHSVSWQADYYARKWYKSAFYMVAITRKTRKKGISIHQIPIFNDLRSEAFTRYHMNLTNRKYLAGNLAVRTCDTMVLRS